jgi:hypothetical protein
MNRISYSWYRFPPEVIQQTISCDLLQGRGRAPALRSRNREAVTLATGTIGRGEGQDEGLESDLLRGMIERLVTKPNAMAAFPNGAGISSATPQQKKPLDALARLPHVLAGDLAHAYEIAHRLVGTIGNPDLVSSPARDSRASMIASRRSVLMRSPARRGV